MRAQASAAARGARRPAQGRLHSTADRMAASAAAEGGCATNKDALARAAHADEFERAVRGA